MGEHQLKPPRYSLPCPEPFGPGSWTFIVQSGTRGGFKGRTFEPLQAPNIATSASSEGTSLNRPGYLPTEPVRAQNQPPRVGRRRKPLRRKRSPKAREEGPQRVRGPIRPGRE